MSTGLPLHAVRAWSYNAYAGQAYMYAAPEIDPSEAVTAQLQADEQLKLAVERTPGADMIACTATAVFGPPSRVLLAQAEGSAMLVVGSRGHGALSRAVLGSVSSSVLHHATVPVAIVPEPRAGDQEPLRVIVGMDHSSAASVALTTAADQARRRGATLVPVYVHEPIEVPRGGAHAPDLALLEDTERHRLDAAAKEAGAADARSDVLVGHAAEQLLDMARPQDLLIVGSRGRGGFTGLLLGSTSTQIAQHTTCPVLIVRA